VDVLISIVGVILGVFTGITPGVHVNTIIPLLNLDGRTLVLVLISASIAHTFLDAIPSTFIGIPDESTAVSLYPAHSMALEGRGIEAVAIATFSGLISVIALTPAFFILSKVKLNVSRLTLPVLLLVTIFLITQERGDTFAGKYSRVVAVGKAFVVLAISGIVGFLALNFDTLSPLFSGLFAFPVLLGGIKRKTEIPEQKVCFKPRTLPALLGSLSGTLTSIFPGISSGIASTIAVSPFKERNSENYVSATGAANTANALMCFAVLISSGKSRSGVAYAISYFYEFLNPVDVFLICIFSATLSAIIALIFALFAGRILHRVNVRLLCSSALIFVALTVVIESIEKPVALIVFALSSLVGLLPEKLGVRRINCMGSLLIPLIAFHV